MDAALSSSVHSAKYWQIVGDLIPHPRAFAQVDVERMCLLAVAVQLKPSLDICLVATVTLCHMQWRDGKNPQCATSRADIWAPVRWWHHGPDRGYPCLALLRDGLSWWCYNAVTQMCVVFFFSWGHDSAAYLVYKVPLQTLSFELWRFMRLACSPLVTFTCNIGIQI